MVLVIDKVPYYQTGALTSQSFIEDNETLVPCRSFDANSPQYLVRMRNPDDLNGNCLLELFSITGSFASNNLAVTSLGILAAPLAFNASAPAGVQDGGPNDIDLGDSRMQSAVFRDGVIWCTHTAYLPATGTATQAGIHLYQIDPTGTPPSVTQAVGFFDTTSNGYQFAYPSVAVNGSNDVLVGMARFGKDIYPQGTYTGRAAADPTNTLRDVGSLLESETDWDLKRWGDYSASVVDPVGDESFWTLQMTTTDHGDQWWTRWMQVPKFT